MGIPYFTIVYTCFKIDVTVGNVRLAGVTSISRNEFVERERVYGIG